MDKVFSQPIKKQFEFDENVASVFDDMLDRSIPFYKEVLQLVCDLVILNTKKDSKIIDLGCSTANTLLQLFKKEQDRVLVGVDNSAAMLENARKKIQAYGAKIELIESDITTVSMQNCDAVIANYMLQFIRPLVRNEFVKKIYDSLNDKGILF